MKKYDLFTIIKPNLDNEETDKVVARVEEIVKTLGGSVVECDKMGGKKAWLQNITDKTTYFRNKAQSLGFKLKTSTPQSNMMSVLEFEDVSAYDIFLNLAEKCRIFVNPCGGDLANKLMRISHVGNTTIADIDDLFEKIQKIIKELKQTSQVA